MVALAKAPPPQKKALACRFRAEDSGELAERQSALNELNGKLFMMNHDVADLLKAASGELAPQTRFAIEGRGILRR